MLQMITDKGGSSTGLVLHVIISATSSGNTYETRQRLGTKVVENLRSYSSRSGKGGIERLTGEDRVEGGQE
jgi:hypothetical protein